MFRSASLFIGTSFTVAVFTIFATLNVDSIVGISHKIYSMQKNLIHIKSRSLCWMCPSAPRVCSEPGGQKTVLSLSLDCIGPWGICPQIWSKLIFKLILVIYGKGISFEIALRWLSLDLTDEKSILVQVMAGWPRFVSPYDVTRPQWVKVISPWQKNGGKITINNFF